MRNDELGVVGVLQELSREIERERSPFSTDGDFNFGLDTALNKIKVLLEDTARLTEAAVTLYKPTCANVCLRLRKCEMWAKKKSLGFWTPYWASVSMRELLSFIKRFARQQCRTTQALYLIMFGTT